MEVDDVKIRGPAQGLCDRSVGVVLESICIASGHELGQTGVCDRAKFSSSFAISCGKQSYRVPLLHQFIYEQLYKQLNASVGSRRNASPERRHLRDTKMS